MNVAIEDPPTDQSESQSFGLSFVRRTIVTVLFMAGLVFLVSLLLLIFLALLASE